MERHGNKPVKELLQEVRAVEMAQLVRYLPRDHEE